MTARYHFLEGAYDHLYTSTESLVAEEAVDSRGVPDWVAENSRIIFRIGDIVSSGTASVEQ